MTSSTSRSLPDVPDILYHVFSYLDSVHHSQYEYDRMHESRRSGALAAGTRQGFTGPALDVLWKRLPGDQPLADLLCEPGIAMKEQHREGLELAGESRPGRYQLPGQGRGGYFDPDDRKAFEQQWRFSNGYNIQYVSVHLLLCQLPRLKPDLPAPTRYRRHS